MKKKKIEVQKQGDKQNKRKISTTNYMNIDKIFKIPLIGVLILLKYYNNLILNYFSLLFIR